MFDADYKNFNIVLHNLPFKITSIQIDNVEVDMNDFDITDFQSITVDKEFTELHLLGN